MPSFKSSFVTTLKTADKLVPNRLKENIFFLHIPKCGGTSTIESIKSRYSILTRLFFTAQLDATASVNIIKVVNQADDPYDSRYRQQIFKVRENLLLYFMSQKKIKYVAGHFPFSDIAYREFGNKYRFITVLRDPVKRFISSYFYVKYGGSSNKIKKEDINTFLESDFGLGEGYQYVKFLSGLDKKTDCTSQQAIDRAKNNLHKFNIVGFIEHQEDFLMKFKDRFGIRLKLEKINTSPKTEPFKKSIITKEIEERIKTICKPDCEIYQYAIDNFLNTNR